MTTPNIPPNPHPSLSTLPHFLSQNYDFLILGGGTSGLVLAARLSSHPDLTIGVLEAGPPNLQDPMILTPALYTQLIGSPNYD